MKNHLIDPLEIEKYGRHSNARYTILIVTILAIVVGLVWLAKMGVYAHDALNCDMNNDGELNLVDLSVLAEVIRNK